MPTFGRAPMPPVRPPDQRSVPGMIPGGSPGPTPAGGNLNVGSKASLPAGAAGGILSGGILPLPGDPRYAAQYKQWMQGPEAQATFQQGAEDQAKVANALNPYSQGYDATAAAGMKASVAGNDNPYDGTAFRNATSALFTPGHELTGQVEGPSPFAQPGPMPVTLAGKPPAPPPVAQPPVASGGVNAWQAARTMRKPMRKPPIGGTGPTKPPQPYAIA